MLSSLTSRHQLFKNKINHAIYSGNKFRAYARMRISLLQSSIISSYERFLFRPSLFSHPFNLPLAISSRISTSQRQGFTCFPSTPAHHTSAQRPLSTKNGLLTSPHRHFTPLTISVKVEAAFCTSTSPAST